jgi:hypothetical protein
MLSPATLVAAAVGQHLAEGYRRAFGEQQPRYPLILDEGARLLLERIASSDALYHNMDHTVMVTLVGQDILRGLRLTRPVSPEDWLHYLLAALTHDIGYIRGICPDDTADSFVIDSHGNRVTPPRGASDAFLTPYHVERSKIMVRDRFRPVPEIDDERVAQAIEMTRFPVPGDDAHAETDTEGGLLRAADLIGQLADPLYPRKLNALFHEFAETGTNERLGYASPADLVDQYPSFFWSTVEPYIGDALRYLELTIEGKQWISCLYSHVFTIEHRRRMIGPQLG